MTAPPAGDRAQLDLGFVRRGDRTVLDRRLFRWPFVLTRTFTLDRAPAHLLTVMIQTSSSAVHRGDRLRQRVRVGPHAAVHCTTPGATPIHGGSGIGPASETVELRVEPDGHLEYMPDARILFPGAALEQAVEVECAAGAAAIVADAFTLHDPEHRGRSFERLRSTLTVRCAGVPLLVECADVGGPDVAAAAPFTAFGALTLVRPGPSAGEPPVAAALGAGLARVAGLHAAVTTLPADAGLAVRLAGHDLQRVRHGLALAWHHLRRDLFGAAPSERHPSAAMLDPDGCATGHRSVSQPSRLRHNVA